MSSVIIIDLDEAGENGKYFAATCSHVNESEEIDDCAITRLSWFKEMHKNGLRVKVGFLDGEPTASLYMIPIEFSTWGPIGNDLMFLYCLFVPDEKKFRGKGLGKALLDAAEEETIKQGKKGLVTLGYFGEFWFLPVPFFEKHGFSVIDRKKVTNIGEREYLDEIALLWKVFDDTAEPPRFLEPNFVFKPVEGKVVIDLFWDSFCQTMVIEAQRVRDVVVEFSNNVILNEYPAEDRDILQKYQISRGIFVNGKEIGWGFEAEKENIRKAIQEALDSL